MIAYNLVFFALTFFFSCYLWRLFGHLCSSVTPERDPCCTKQDSKAQPLSIPQRGLCNSEIGNMRQLSEIAFLTSWTRVRKMPENVGNLAANFLRTPECRVHCRPPSALHSPRSNSAVLGFSRLVAHCHTSQSFEPTISLTNSHGASPHNQAAEK